MDVQIINREPQLVAYIRVIGPYNETMPDGFNRLMAWAEPRNLLADRRWQKTWSPVRVHC
jgi:DNA gyrase inhibitor GyrI